jgi:hypothetical protein
VGHAAAPVGRSPAPNLIGSASERRSGRRTVRIPAERRMTAERARASAIASVAAYRREVGPMIVEPGSVLQSMEQIARPALAVVPGLAVPFAGPAIKLVLNLLRLLVGTLAQVCERGAVRFGSFIRRGVISATGVLGDRGEETFLPATPN